MRKCRNWVLTLALMAAPGVTLGGPFDNPFGGRGGDAASAAPSRGANANQKVAEEIAAALRQARLQGYDIDIEYKNGVATLSGKVADPRQKEMATKVVRNVDGVRSVNNKLIVLPAPTQETAEENPFSRGGGVQPADFRSAGRPGGGVEQVGLNLPKTAASAMPPARPAAAAEAPAQRGPSPQQVANEIATTLSDAGLSGQEIDIRFENGKAVLTGSVESASMKAKASQVAQSVAGVRAVDNRLSVADRREASAVQYPERQPQPRNPYVPANYQSQAGIPGAPGPGTPPPAPMPPNGMVPPGAPMGPGPNGVPGYGGGYPGAAPYGAGMAGSAAAYDNPYVPNYAWPAYAQYPNSAAVNYPTQYSASAWPYIGPFYPYPQVPLGWRAATLEWDDGYWNLSFNNRTDKWWWFLNPKNWHSER